MTPASAGSPERGEPNTNPWNLPNALTVLRILMVPLFLVLLLAAGGQDPTMRMWAFAVFAAAMITDKIDGDLARKWNIVTDFGKLADPIADKTLMSAALIGLVIVGTLPWWVPVVILVREFGITVMRLAIAKRIVLPASKGGKLKTVLQTVALGLFILWVPVAHIASGGVTVAFLVIAWVILVAAIVVTLVTGVDYVRQVARLLREQR